MANIKPDKLVEAIAEELTIYHEGVDEKLREITQRHVTDLVKKTKATAPVGKSGSFRKNIAGDFRGLKKGRNIKGVWYVKAPDHRLTHLVVHGHAKKNGGRTKANPFLHNALNEVLPAFEKEVEEAIKND